MGHGPFSHLFDGVIIPRVHNKYGIAEKWTHEIGSGKMLQYLIDDNSLQIDKQDVDFIISLINGGPCKDANRRFLYQIVSNEDYGVDVDKLDYLARDCHYTGVKASTDYHRLSINNKVIDGQLRYDSKESYNLYMLFHTRYSLWKQIYTHRVVRAIDLMLTDIILEAEEFLDLKNVTSDMSEYCRLTDSIVKEIETTRNSSPALDKSKALIKRLRKRDLYAFVDQQIVTDKDGQWSKKITANNVVGSFSGCGDGTVLTEDDVLVDDFKINWGSGENNPVDKIGFYNRRCPMDGVCSIDPNQVSLLTPAQFQERIVRVYTRSNNKGVQKAVKSAFEQFLRSNRLLTPPRNTPTPPPNSSPNTASPTTAPLLFHNP
eukprot:TRINITY_DN53081_c0_g1_i2.p1 TRINITY_DN53081_c0_g1~~TRINITY_DN53081_c0_g1_i2.p1  ORF type:complete len:374 (+),score=21.69 TRINITY_DN53081_c0_g1_i2:102-1223(+)